MERCMLIINPTAGRERAKYHKDALKAQLAAKAGRRRKLEAFMAQLREKEALARQDGNNVAVK